MSTALYLNGNIYTMDAARPRAQAMAIDLSTGRILAIGLNNEVHRPSSKYTELVDLRGQTVIPGFIDAHVHLLATAYRSREVDAIGCTSEDNVAALVRARATQTPPGQWIQGSHWDKNLWPEANFPTKASLDAAAPDHPVALRSKDGHSLWCNSLALQCAGITAQTPEPATGAILRDGSGEPTGILQESSATNLVYTIMQSPDLAMSRQLIEQILPELQRCGITTIHNIEGEPSLSIFRQLCNEGKLGVRVQMILPRRMLPLHSSFTIDSTEHDLLCVSGIKIFADGALGGLTAAMLESFEEHPDNYGILTLSEQQILESIRVANKMGLFIAIHAIGDRATHVALNAIERAQQQIASVGDTVGAKQRYRLEHVQLVAPNDLERMHRLKVIASIQPFHAVADRDVAERYWGKRHLYAYAYATMQMMGIPLAIGSDTPVETFDPFHILYAATVRRDPATPRPPWLPEQALSVTEALWGYTLGAAYAGAEETSRGSLTVGKLGDAVVLREDILSAPQEKIVENGVQATILGGNVVYGNV